MEDEAICVFCQQPFTPDQNRSGFGITGDGSVAHERCMNYARETVLRAFEFRTVTLQEGDKLNSKVWRARLNLFLVLGEMRALRS